MLKALRIRSRTWSKIRIRSKISAFYISRTNFLPSCAISVRFHLFNWHTFDWCKIRTFFCQLFIIDRLLLMRVVCAV